MKKLILICLLLQATTSYTQDYNLNCKHSQQQQIYPQQQQQVNTQQQQQVYDGNLECKLNDTIEIKPKQKPKKSQLKIARTIKVHESAFLDAISWCEHRGGLKYIEVDAINNNLQGSWRYICNRG